MLRQAEELHGIKLLEARCFPDERGFLLQSHVRSDLERQGIPGDFPQAIQSRSKLGVVRGLHFQWEPPQGKLVRCVHGSIFDVVVDLRIGSPTLGDHLAVEMTGENHRVLWVPPGFGHGFMALEEGSVVLYACTSEWNPRGESGILWNDEALSIAWPALHPLLSPKDARNPTLEQWLADPRAGRFAFR
jgi:dTDP-4-dehydrorhamnose 3,5-epimerase